MANNYQISKWSNIWNKIIYGWDLNLINTDYSLVIDTSHWEYDSKTFDKVKFKEKAKELNLRALIFKLSDANAVTGKLYYDVSAEFWYNLAQECDLLTTGYHWLQKTVDPKVAYNFYNDWVKDHPLSLPPCLDFEEPSCSSTPIDYLWRAKTFLELSGDDTILYTGMGYINTLKQNIGSDYDSHMSFLKKYTLWLARYSRYVPTGLYPWSDWSIWQYSDSADFPYFQSDSSGKGKDWGMSANGLDMNWAKNSYLDKFTQSASSSPIETETTVKEEKGDINSNNMKFKIVVPSLYVREGPGTSNTIISKLKYGDIVEIDDISGTDAWVKIGDGQWACKKQGTNYMEKVEEE